MELLSVTMNDGVIKRSEIEGKDNSSEDKRAYKIVHKGDMVYNSMRMWQGANGVSSHDGIVSPAYTVLSPREELEQGYFAALFKTPRLVNEFRKNSQGLTSDTWNLKYPQISKIKIALPTLAEQRKISLLLKLLDDRIGCQRKLVDSLKLYKRGLVRRIFPQKESLQPELRMTTYSGPWHSAKIGDLGSVLMCKRIYKEQTSTSGEVPFYKIGTFGGTADAYIPRELFMEYKAKYPYPQKGDVLISASGSIGRTVVFSGKDEYFQDSNIIWVRFDGTITNPFWKHLCEQLTWVGIEGSTIKRLYNDNVLNTRISFPAIEEQKSISELLDRIDSGICQAEEVTSALVTMKNALMQQLFI